MRCTAPAGPPGTCGVQGVLFRRSRILARAGEQSRGRSARLGPKCTSCASFSILREGRGALRLER
eukprot:12342450-Heterocapsa_arctica.AAC.1